MMGDDVLLDRWEMGW